jgi:hypothetical protein
MAIVREDADNYIIGATTLVQDNVNDPLQFWW